MVYTTLTFPTCLVNSSRGPHVRRPGTAAAGSRTGLIALYRPEQFPHHLERAADLGRRALLQRREVLAGAPQAVAPPPRGQARRVVEVVEHVGQLAHLH